MIILGVDPGVASVGYGVIRFEKGKHVPITFGTFHTEAGLPLPTRLIQINDFLNELIDRFKPDIASVEELFFNTNAKTALMVGQGRGAILLSCAQNSLPIFEFTPLQIKQAVVGYGRADKNQVQQMVKMILKLKEIPKPDDTADALAAAICCANTQGSKLLVK